MADIDNIRDIVAENFDRIPVETLLGLKDKSEKYLASVSAVLNGTDHPGIKDGLTDITKGCKELKEHVDSFGKAVILLKKLVKQNLS